MKSLWEDYAGQRSFRKLNENINTDVLIVGGGMAGVLCAYFLQKAGIGYVLTEGERICGGVTKNTSAKITSQHGLIYDKLTRKAGFEKAKMYLEANERAIQKFKALNEEFPCDFEEKDAYIYSMSDRKSIEKEVGAVNKLGYKAEFKRDLPLPVEVAGAIKFEHQAQFNPLKLIAGISTELNIYENTFIKEFIGNNTAVAGNCKIKYKRAVIATHFPFINKHGGYFLKMYQHRSYILALENAPDVSGMYLEETKDGLSFRNYKNFLLVGGGDHKTGKEGGNWKVLREFAKKAYPEAVEKYAWATQDCMTLDGVPYIGRYSKSAPDVYVASGFNKWGMTSSMIAAEIICDMLAGKHNKFAEVFSPQRSIMKPQLFLNACTAVSNLLRFSTKRCPHLGCALKWNNVEQSWDCPCHGSRFERDGKLINNPATGDLKK